ncbi:MAG TPA: hypothetical protein IAC79_03930 [Candidatus Spyradenecus faecavium]|uniref:Uncharacterized protein n=1 Tax=Candidatus Spyradenecus faecavium TaxID=2840947 RepID=A0A9D1NM57_9BACT|nr:hypothetical protein [Candidatus Spyradenecus faecavium]
MSRFSVLGLMRVGVCCLGLLGVLSPHVLWAAPDYLSFESVSGSGIDGTWRLSKIDRSRKYETIDLTAVALGRCVTELAVTSTVEIEAEDGETEERTLPLFKDVSVKTLILPDTITEIDTKAFEGVRDLETIVFEGRAPTFKEGKRLFWFQDEAWRAKLKRIVFRGEVNPWALGAVLSGVPCIEFAPTADFSAFRTVEGRQGKKNAGTRLLADASSLERLIVPYSLAVQADIPWRSFLIGSPLEDREVASRPSVEEPEKFDVLEADPTVPGFSRDENAICLINCDEDGTISDGVTDLRLEAFFGLELDQRIWLPTRFRRFVGYTGELANYAGRFWIKRDVIRFEPDVASYRQMDSGREVGSAALSTPSETKSDRYFADIFSHAELAAVSPYKDLVLSASIIEGPDTGLTYLAKATGADEARGRLAYEMRLSLPMNRRYALQTKLRLPAPKGEEERYLLVNVDSGRNTETITFVTPPERHWVLSSITQVASVLGGIWLFLLFIHGLFKGSWADRNLYQPMVQATWWQQTLLVGSVLLLVLGWNGVLSSWVQVYLWTPVMRYINSSFISSLVISVSTTLLQITLGLLKGISVAPFGIGVSLEHVIGPCTDLLARVGWVSWVATTVLAFMRVVAELLREAGSLLWMLLGGVTLLYTVPIAQMEALREKLRFSKAILCVVAFLTLGLPIFLWGCSWMSQQLMAAAGNTFDAALVSFRCLADAFSFSAFLSLSALQELAGLLTDAMAELTSAAIMYVMTKVFDCFLMPLGLIWMVLRLLKLFGIGQDVSLHDFLRKDAFRQRFLPARAAPASLPAADEAQSGALPQAKTSIGARRPKPQQTRPKRRAVEQ